MTIDARDIHSIADIAATASKVLKERGKRAWDRAGDFDPAGVRGRPFDRGTPGTRLDEDGVPILTVDRVGDEAVDDHTPHHHRSEFRDALRALDTAATRLVDLVDELTRTKMAIPPKDPRGWCPNCRSAGVTEPSALRSDGSQRFRDRDGRCRPCIEFKSANGFDRPQLIIARKAEGRRLSQAEADRAINRARREHELEQRKATQRVETHRQQRASNPQIVRCPSTMTRQGNDLQCELQTRNGTHPGPHLAEHDGTVHNWANHTEGAA